MTRVIGTSWDNDLVGTRNTDDTGSDRVERVSGDDLCCANDPAFGRSANGDLDRGIGNDPAGQAPAQRARLGPNPSVSWNTALVIAMLVLGMVASLLTSVAIDARLTAIEGAIGKHAQRLQRVEAATGVLE
jgi:hypothetical protein